MHHTGMAELTGKAISAQMGNAIGEDATAKTMTQRDHEEVLHAVGTAKGVLTQSSHIGIVAQRHSHSQTVAQHSGHRHHTLPRKVRCILNATCQIVAAWSADAH